MAGCSNLKEIKTMQQKQIIGRSKGAGRICIWNRAIITAGFPIGQCIKISSGAGGIEIRPDQTGRRSVSGVMNHGKRLPVIDLKQTKVLDISVLGEIGDQVEVTIAPGKITIRANH